jgi:hypothetical protein
MSDHDFQAPPPTQPGQPARPTGTMPAPSPTQDGTVAAYGYAPLPVPAGRPPVGTIRSTGVCVLLTVVTLGFYSLYWFYAVHDEMKRHSGQGLGGGIALLIAFFIGFVSPYLTSSEVGQLYAARGQERPVSGITGLWYFPGMLILVGPLVWFVKTNGAINAYWRSCA